MNITNLSQTSDTVNSLNIVIIAKKINVVIDHYLVAERTRSGGLRGYINLGSRKSDERRNELTEIEIKIRKKQRNERGEKKKQQP